MTIGKVGEARRVFYSLRLGSGAPALLVAPGDMLVTVDNPAVSTTSTPAAVEIAGGRYYFDIPAAFTTTNGAGTYGGNVVVSSTTPRVVDVVPFEVVFSVQDFDDLATQTSVDAIATTGGPGPWTTATGFSTHSAADVDTTLTAAHGAGAWITATGFAVAGDAMALTGAAETSLLAVFDTAHGVGSWVGAGLTAAQGIQLQETWTSLGNNIGAPATFDFPGLLVQALANTTPIDIVISVAGTAVTLTRQP